jgi:hypothetical protein
MAVDLAVQLMKKASGMTAPDGRGSIGPLMTGAIYMEPRPSEFGAVLLRDGVVSDGLSAQTAPCFSWRK